MWVYTVYLALCIHLMNAKRVQLVDSNDGLFCECKTAESRSECNWQRKFYHPEVGKWALETKNKASFLQLSRTRYFHPSRAEFSGHQNSHQPLATNLLLFVAPFAAVLVIVSVDVTFQQLSATQSFPPMLLETHRKGVLLG